MNTQPDVLAVLTEAAALLRNEPAVPAVADAVDRARAAEAELIAADREYDYCKASRIDADNRITRGERSDDNFVRQANARHAYDRAVERRRLALARVGGGA